MVLLSTALVLSCLASTAAAAPEVAEERPTATWPCFNDSDRGFKVAFYATTYDGRPGAHYDFYLGKSCNPPGGVDFNVRIRHWGFPDVPDKVVCMSPGEVIQVGFKWTSQAPPHPNAFFSFQMGGLAGCQHQPGDPISPPPMEFTGPFPLDPVPPCPELEPNAPWCGPRTVTATGTVGVKRHPDTEDLVPLAGAWFEVLYLDADAGWQPARTGPGDTANPARGYVDEHGRFAATFTYPSRYDLPDGTPWEGCAPAADGSRFADAHACEAGHIQVRVHPVTEGNSILVLDVGQTDTTPAVTVDIGQFFKGTADGSRTVAQSPTAHAFGGAVAVDRIAEGRLGHVRIQMAHRISQYDPDEETIYLEPYEAAMSTTKHEVAHRLHHSLTGEHFGYSDCPDEGHSFTEPSGVRCAFEEGFASFIAAVAENPPGEASRPRASVKYGYLEMEKCGVSQGAGHFQACKPGHEVEGHVAAAFWDLYDSTPGEKLDGFADHSRHTLGSIYETMSRAPLQFDAFWWTWSFQDAARTAEAGTVFANQQVRHGIVDAAPASTTGTTWTATECWPCRGGSALTYAPAAGSATPSATWPLSRAFWNDKRRFDVWINVPSGVGRDSRAVYEITTETGTRRYTVDQNTQIGWTKLTPQPVDLTGSSVLKLLPGDPAAPRALVADAVLLVPF